MFGTSTEYGYPAIVTKVAPSGRFDIAVEALLCGAITFTIGSGVKALGYEGWDLFIGGTVGAFGSQYVRALGQAWMKRKAESVEGNKAP